MPIWQLGKQERSEALRGLTLTGKARLRLGSCAVHGHGVCVGKGAWKGSLQSSISFRDEPSRGRQEDPRVTQSAQALPPCTHIQAHILTELQRPVSTMFHGGGRGHDDEKENSCSPSPLFPLPRLHKRKRRYTAAQHKARWRRMPFRSRSRHSKAVERNLST